MRKYIIFSVIFALLLCNLSAQTNNIYQSGGISLTVGAPTYKPGAKGNVVAIDTVTGSWYISRDRYAANGSWMPMGDRIETISGCSAPMYTPNKMNSELVINNCTIPEIYHHTGGGVWACLNCATSITTDATLSGAGTSGSPLKIAQQSATSGQVLKWNGTTWLPAADAGTTYTGGTGIDVTGTVISNTAPDQTVTITGGGINSVSGTYPSFTVTGTEVDGSATNELQTIANTSDATSHTVTLSNAGGSVQLVEGSNVTLTTTGTSGDAVVAIAASGGTTDLSVSGSSSPLTINSSTGTDITATAGSGISLAGTSGNMTITNSSPSLWTDSGTDTYLTSTTDNVAIGATSAGSKLDIRTDALGTTQTNTSGLLLSNTTAAAAGAQQISPAIRWRGSGWKTNATAASQTVDFRAYALPVQGTTAPTGALIFQSAINGGAYTNTLSVSSTDAVGIRTTAPAAPLNLITKYTTDGRTDQQGMLIEGPNIYAPNSAAYHIRFANTNGGAASIGVDGGSVVRWGAEAFLLLDGSGNQTFYYANRLVGFNAGYAVRSNDATGFPNHYTVRLGMRDNNTGNEYNLLTADPKGDAILITPFASTDIGLVIKGAASQTANLTNWKNSSGTILSSVDASGKVAIGSASAPTDFLEVTGNVNLKTAGNKLKIATGSNASIGTSTLVAGTVTVSTTAVATGSIIMVSCNTPGGTQGILSAPVASITNATSFIINSSNAADTSTVNWWIIN